MHFLTGTEIEALCKERGIPFGVDGRPLDNPALTHRQRVAYTGERFSGSIPSVAAACLDALGPWDECLLWVTGWGAKTSGLGCEDFPAFCALRAEQSEQRSLDQAPGHLFQKTEAELFRTYLVRVMENGWGAFVLPMAKGSAERFRIEISTAEWVDLLSSEPVPFGEVRATARRPRKCKGTSICRYVVAAILLTVGCVGLFFHSSMVAMFGFCFMGVPFLINTELKRPLGRDITEMAIAFLAGVGILIAFVFMDTDSGWLIISHPAFLISVWVLVMLVLYRRWQRNAE